MKTTKNKKTNIIKSELPVKGVNTNLVKPKGIVRLFVGDQTPPFKTNNKNYVAYIAKENITFQKANKRDIVASRALSCSRILNMFPFSKKLGIYQMPKIFIGSSLESKEYAEKIKKELLISNYDVTVWDDDCFELSKSFLASLYQIANDFDFAIIILNSDDIVISRESVKDAPRDNLFLNLASSMER